MKTGVYAGSFDPGTKGHMWMIKEGSELFDKLIVAIGTNPGKKPTFSFEERKEMLEKSTRGLSNVIIDEFPNKYLVKYAESVGATHLLRGIRSEKDFESENEMRYINHDINPDISTVFLMPNRELVQTSSSTVKGLIGPEGWENEIQSYLTTPVYNKMLERFDGYFSNWSDLMKSVNAKGDTRAVYDLLKTNYSEPHRDYLNLIHIGNSLNEFEKIKSMLNDPNAVELAIWMHDAIYRTDIIQDNEQLTGNLSSIELTNLSVHNALIKSVDDLILATKHEDQVTDKDTQFMLDIDLAILGAPKNDFDEYEQNIRFEYSQYSDEDYKKGRIEVLNQFLKRKTIFQTEFFKDKYENEARNNLKRSLEMLR